MSRRAPIEVAGRGEPEGRRSKEKMRFEAETTISNKARFESLQT